MIPPADATAVQGMRLRKGDIWWRLLCQLPIWPSVGPRCYTYAVAAAVPTDILPVPGAS